ncbi:MAG: zinc metalloprotease HtpX [Candidatus Aureabacteria bacterium]|nr:zinc metalloprotease HtpX [Candidatus Auribacterota bacterium]NLW93973.1 zinc metalloprotease HtpX [Chlamydiota bacterium]HOE27447.1 zinc metalloprotease HtpX [bacterium]HQM52710.1 zinc metalloprotease HtpX [bacterium]
MYEQIARNKRNSVVLCVLFVAFVAFLGWVFGQVSAMGNAGVVIAVAVAVAWTFGSYYWSDRIVLAMSGARPLVKEEFPHLFHAVEGLAIAGGLPVPRVYVIEDSAPNAFATGRDPAHAVVCVTTGLLQKMNRLELEGVVAHELSHIRNYDILLGSLVVVMVGVVTLLSDWIFRSFFWGGRRRRDNRGGGGQAQAILLIVALLLALLAPLVAQLVRLAISRRREFLADASAAMLTRYPKGLADALRKLDADSDPLEAANKATAHMYIVNPLRGDRGMVSRLFSTHPPVAERIRALEGI